MHLPGFLADHVAHDGGNALGIVKVDVGDAATGEDADDADGTAVAFGVGVEEAVEVGVGGLAGDVADDDGGVGVATGGFAGGTTAGGGGRALAAGLGVVLAAVATVVGGRRGGGSAVSSTTTSTTVLLGVVVLASTLLLALLGGGGISGRRGGDGRRSTGLDAAGPGLGDLGSRDGGSGSLGGGLEIILAVLGGTVGGRGGAGGSTRIASGALLGFLLVGRLGSRLGGSSSGVGRGVLSWSLVLGLLVGGRSLAVGIIVGGYLVGSLRSRSRSLLGLVLGSGGSLLDESWSSSLLLGGLTRRLGTGSSSLLGLGGSLGISISRRRRLLLGLHDTEDVVVDVVLLLPTSRGRVGQDDGVDEGPIGDDGGRAREVHVPSGDEEDGAVDGVLGIDASLGAGQVDGEDVIVVSAILLRGLDGVGPGEGVVGKVGEKVRHGGLALVVPGGGADVLDLRIGMVEVADAIRVVRQHFVVLLDEGPGDVEGVGGPVRLGSGRGLRLRRRGGAHDDEVVGNFLLIKQG